MMINKENIDEHIFDYLEGNLNDEQISEFKEYINSDKEAKSEFEYWKQSYVSDNYAFNSVGFDHLKKSYRVAQWTSGIAAAFLIGAASMYIFMQDKPVEEHVQAPLKQNNEQINIITPSEIDEVKSTSIQEEIVKKPLQIKVAIPQESNVENENTPVMENIDFSDNRGIDFKSSETARTPITEKVKIAKAEEDLKKNKKSEVDVIELNSEGF